MEQELEHYIGELHAMKFVHGVMKTKFSTMREEVKNTNKKIEQQAATIAELEAKCAALHDINAKFAAKYNSALIQWQEDRKCAYDEHERNKVLMGTINVLVHDWLTPDQREALTNKDGLFEKNKKNTLERKTARDQRSSELFFGRQ